MAANWWAEAGEAWVANGDGEILWHGTAVGPRVLDAFTLADTDDGIVVLDWSSRPPGVLAWHPYPNLVRLRTSGELVWQADLPPGESVGSWTGAEIREGRLIAHGWQSECDLDPATGIVTASRFTK
jgi:hypothetical protein